MPPGRGATNGRIPIYEDGGEGGGDGGHGGGVGHTHSKHQHIYEDTVDLHAPLEGGGGDDVALLGQETQPRPRPRLRTVAVLMLLQGVSGSSWGRYGTLFYMSAGITTQQIGVLGAARPVVSFFAAPTWGVVADVLRNRKAVYITTGLASVTCILLLAVGRLADAFWKILLLTVASALFSSAGIVDAFALGELKKVDREDEYGKLRLWTAVSWGVGNPVFGFLCDRYGFGLLFYSLGALTALQMAICHWCIPPQPQQAPAQPLAAAGGAGAPEPLRVADFFRRVLADRGVAVLLVMLTFFGMGFGIVDSLLFVYLKDEFGASKLLCGLTVTANVVFEIPIFYYAKQIQAAMGHQAMVAVALLAYSTRVYGYTLLTAGNYKLVLALEGLHGLTFAMMWTATVAIATKISPPEWRSATMAVVQAFMGCLGWGGGSAVGGWAAQQYGFRPMFRVAACTFAGLQVLHLASWKLGVFKF